VLKRVYNVEIASSDPELIKHEGIQRSNGILHVVIFENCGTTSLASTKPSTVL